jgi:hypothetical protein
MPFTKFTNLDFDQIKESIKDYLRSNSDFTGFDFDGSNFSVLIDTLAYNTYITAFNSNMVVNESFLDSATLRENVISLARTIGYVPRSRKAARAGIYLTLDFEGTTTPTITIKKGLFSTGNIQNSSYIFSVIEDLEVTTQDISYINNQGENVDARRAVFGSVTDEEPIEIYQGTLLTKNFVYDGSLDQRFILDNPYIDTSLLKVYVKKENETLGEGAEYSRSDTIFDIDSNALVYFINEIQDEKYEIKFGDGLIGKKLETGDIITVNYIVSDGENGNGASAFSFSGLVLDQNENPISPDDVVLTTAYGARYGASIESVESVKYYAPKIYATQNRTVTSRDYETVIRNIYPNTESVSVVGGEELDPPQFGNVQISIKPNNGYYISEFDKSNILAKLKQYSVSGINQKIVDLKLLYVELDSFVYYDDSKISSKETLRSNVIDSLTEYSRSVDVNSFGGRLRYSKLLNVIDSTNKSITSNITRIKIRRNLNALVNEFAQYELCFGNQFHVNSEGFNIKSTGFKISGDNDIVYLTDIPNTDKQTGVLSVVKQTNSGEIVVVVKSAGSVDYIKGEININTLNISSTVKPNNIVEIQAFPESNDVVGLRDLYLQLDISKSKINMINDIISSGDERSGTVFTRDLYTSSYSNGKLVRE